MQGDVARGCATQIRESELAKVAFEDRDADERAAVGLPRLIMDDVVGDEYLDGCERTIIRNAETCLSAESAEMASWLSVCIRRASIANPSRTARVCRPAIEQHRANAEA